MIRLLIIPVIISILNGCGSGSNGNLSVNTFNSTCPNAGNAPYCMAVQVMNNSGGQNYINSNNFPISNLSIQISSPNNNLIGPNTDTTLDPNNCENATIAPGGNCTFYLQLLGTKGSISNVVTNQITINYNTKSSLYSDQSTGTYTFNVYELTNLYVNYITQSLQTNFIIMNGAWSTSGYLNNYQANDATVDSKYGLLYYGTNSGIVSYDVGNNILNKQQGPSLTGGVITSLLSFQNTLFAINYNAPNSSLYNIPLSSAQLQQTSWVGPSPVSTDIVSNIATSSLSTETLYFAGNGGQVVSCTPDITVNPALYNNCVNEGTPVDGTDITALLFASSPISGSTTPLVVSTTKGLFVENTDQTWQNLANFQFNSLIELTYNSTQSSSTNYIFGGGDVKLYIINENDNTLKLEQISVPPGLTGKIKLIVSDPGPITDLTAVQIYIATSIDSNNFSLYKCQLNITALTMNCSFINSIPKLIGLNVGSLLTGNLNNPGILIPST